MNILKKKSAKRILAFCIVILAIAGICAVYLNDYYRADQEQITSFLSENSASVCPDENGYLVFTPENAKAGFIFYPGGKVEYTAYMPLMDRLAAEGILCVLVKMPCNLAVLDMDAAEGIPEQYPEIENWYIGGHSLGGSMAAAYLAECADAYEGLVLLGSYSTANLSETDLSVLSIYGSEDLVMNREKYEQNKINLPTDFAQIIIDGGCHAYFGMYGPQDGDGTPAISNETQITDTADAIISFIHDGI